MSSVRSVARRTLGTQWQTRWQSPVREFCSYPSRSSNQRPSRDDSDRKQIPTVRQIAEKAEREEQASSLVEQLFPEETKRYQAQKAVPRDVPKKTFDLQGPADSRRPEPTKLVETRKPLPPKQDLKQCKPDEGVLFVRNASVNLTQEDFLRVVPEGVHIEGWRTASTEFEQVVPLRDPNTLAHLGQYYLVFPTEEAAETYRYHAERLQRVAANNISTSELSPLPYPPGFQEDDVDIDNAIRSYTLALPSQPLQFLQLRWPFKPEVNHILKHKGKPLYQQRHGRTPFEVRFAMEGPQLSVGALRHVILEDGIERGQSWSGVDGGTPNILEWDPVHREVLLEDRERKPARAVKAGVKEVATRTMNPIFIISFPTKQIAQSFVCYWHRRTIEKKKISSWEMEFAFDAPIADVQLL
ncbi:uncharacterized protein K489DRAFT_376387 [Dissoconium aciculare CBS 342.82]|uniref:Uncharacterized protein n=1 Tax=Dissoconium aciculare CBS 342.82 TaxID=1314786 RepID=A0A6J3MDA0_9PEZI|nr:uncharacterized protein K489DRAFT_376387 [Dissoconium aciculare CBS 342.82]KAF1825990.1 hypothetical protein K489DRAFT_376387 [Dissoconium aciculare CBS 342.82]